MFSSLGKIFEHMLKSKPDWCLKTNSILPSNIFAFRKGTGTSECFSTFKGYIYHTFNNREFLVAIFIDILSAFDSVNISTLVGHHTSKMKELGSNAPKNIISWFEACLNLEQVLKIFQEEV